MEVLDQITVDLTVEQVLKLLHMEHGSRYASEVEKLLAQALPILRPKAMYDVKFVEHVDDNKVKIGDVQFKSRILRVNLENVGRVFPYIITAGTEVESIKVPDEDLMGKFILDTIKEVGLRSASNYLYQYIKDKYKIDKMSTMSPGSLEDWPISEQVPLFSIFGDVEKLIGVKLTKSFLMIPIKSVSGIYFPTEVSFYSCQLCPREKCPNRKAKYEPSLKDKYMST